jgi:hypothetical protein
MKAIERFAVSKLVLVCGGMLPFQSETGDLKMQ